MPQPNSFSTQSGFSYRFQATRHSGDQKLSITVLDASNDCYEVFELPGESFASGEHKFSDFYHSDCECSVDQWRQSVLETKKVAALEFRIVTPSGSTKWVRETLHPASQDQDEEVWIATVLDISSEKESSTTDPESDTNYRQLVEFTADVFWSAGIDAPVNYLSPQFQEMFGYDPADRIGRSEYELVHPDDLDDLQQTFENGARDGKPVYHEFRHRCKDGSYMWVMAAATAVLDKHGKAVSYQGIMRDISQRKELEQRQERMTKILQSTSDFVGVCHPTKGILWSNKPFKDLRPDLDIEQNQIPITVLYPDWALNIVQYEAIPTAIEQGTWSGETALLTEDGNEIPTSQVIIAHKNDDGSIDYFSTILRDISIRKETEHALQKSQAQFLRMTENVPGMIYRYVIRADDSHCMEFVSSQCRDMYEIEPEEVLADADKLFACLNPDDKARFAAALQESRLLLTPFRVEYCVTLPIQGLRWRQSIGRPTRYKNDDTIRDCVSIDITNRKQAEFQMQVANDELALATKMKDEFLANMSHELRTPLNAILGMNEGLSEGMYGPITEQQKESFEVIRQSGSHLLDLINEVLDLAKIESGSAELELAAVDVGRLCETSIQLVTQQADKKNIQVSLSVPPKLPEIQADEKRLRQVFVNLLSNAVKFTPAGGTVSIAVSQISNTTSDVQTLRVAVSDTGIGIDAQHAETIFQPFVQIDSSLSRNYVGTGLGLSLVKRFVELHSGSVSVKSELGSGTCFTIDLPYRKLSPQAPQVSDSSSTQRLFSMKSDSKQPKPNANVRFATILLAEDNENVALATTRYLEMSGFRVLEACDGEAAVQVAIEHHPDLILMDIQMPRVDGLQAITRIRNTPKLEQVPIIALTGLAMPSDASRCLECGANRYVVKPYCISELVQAIHELLPSDDKVPV